MIISPENIVFNAEANDYEQAIRAAGALLVRSGAAKPSYVDAMVEAAKTFKYIVLAPGVAMPHARPEQGAIETQIGITLFREGVSFEGKEETAKLFVTLAAKDSDSHVDALVKISELLSDEEKVESILASPDQQTLYHYFERI